MPDIQFDHIAIAAARMAEAPAVLAGVLGGAPCHGGLSRAYRFGQWRYANGGRLEILEPTDPEGFLQRFLDKHGPGIHHVTFKVPSLRAACARARQQGYDVVGYDDANPHWKEAFLHPKQALGIVVQFAESEGGEEALLRGWQPPPAPPDPPPPVTLLGLRVSARSAERARRQWQAVVEAEATEAAGALVFRWAGSPMRIVVEIDPARDEGPLCIEYATARPVTLAPGPHPVLGAVFARVAG